MTSHSRKGQGTTVLREVGRRDALRMLAGLAIMPAASGQPADRSGAFVNQPTGTPPAIPKWPAATEPRQIWLSRPASGESAVIRYFDGRTFYNDQYLLACMLLRDVQSGVVAHIDLTLLDLIFAMQKWLVEWGIDRPLSVHSGFRTVHTNSREGGVQNSFHTRGRAVDFSMQAIPADYLGRMAAILGAGGVGFYVGRNFVHGDTGAVRYWNGR